MNNDMVCCGTSLSVSFQMIDLIVAHRNVVQASQTSQTVELNVKRVTTRSSESSSNDTEGNNNRHVTFRGVLLATQQFLTSIRFEHSERFRLLSHLTAPIMSRPEELAPPEIWYGDDEANKYTGK